MLNIGKKNVKCLVTGNCSWWWSLWAATWSSTNELRQKHSSCSSIWTIPYGPYFTTGGNTHFLHQNSSENKVIVHVLCPWCRIKGPCVVVFIIIFIVYQARHNAMPALTANSVTLDEILEVRAGPLKEEELWAILSHSSEALQDVLIKGIAVKCSVFWGLIHQL